LGDCVDKRSKKLIPRKLYKCDAFTLLRFLEQKGLIDESKRKLVKDTIRDSKPELYELATTGLVEQGNLQCLLIGSSYSTVSGGPVTDI
jgi:hypothetical protein